MAVFNTLQIDSAVSRGRTGAVSHGVPPGTTVGESYRSTGRQRSVFDALRKRRAHRRPRGVGVVVGLLCFGLQTVAQASWDFGDAPQSYRTNPGGGTSTTGAAHLVDLTAFPVTLGPSVDNDCLGLDVQSYNCPITPASSGADQDDLGDGDGDGIPDPPDDENGVGNFPAINVSPGDTYRVTVMVTDQQAQASFKVCGWVDFDLTGAAFADGIFNSDERVCLFDSDPACVRAGPEFTCAMDFVVPADFVYVPDEDTYARFRVCPRTSPCDFPFGQVRHGEVEDYLVAAGTLPVSLNGFSSRPIAQGIQAKWGTASETFNIGFRLFGRVGDEWHMLTRTPVPSKAPDSATPQHYRALLKPGHIPVSRIEALALASLDTTGREEWFGPFEVGKSYGEQLAPARIDWGVVRRDMDERLARLGFARGEPIKNVRSRTRLRALLDRVNRRENRETENRFRAFTDKPEARVTVRDPGMQRVTYEALAAAGVDLRDIPVGAVAVAYKSAGVPRFVRSRDRRFGPGDSIEFWGEAPAGDDALYIDKRVYRVLVDRDLALEAIRVDRPVDAPARQASVTVVRDRPVRYQLASSTGDPWVEGQVVSFGSASSAQYTLTVDRPVDDSVEGRLLLRLAGLTDWPHGGDDHHVRVTVNGDVVADVTWDGQTAHHVETSFPGGVVREGDNLVVLTVPGDTGHAYDGVIVDRITLGFGTRLSTRDGPVVFDDDAGVHDGFFVADPGTRVTAFATHEGNLAELRVGRAADGSTFPSVAAGNARYWVSRDDALFEPDIHRADDGDPLPDRADYLIIAHPSFLPVAGDDDHPLSQYLAAKRDEGWNPAVVDTESIYASYGWDMPLPGAMTRMLAEADRRFSYDHVLLVGGDCYDYLDYLGTGCVSFVPTRYAHTGDVIHFTPSDALIADLDGDTIADKAIGRWPVRDLAGLAAMVHKTLAWSSPEGGMRYARTAVWAADSDDPRAGSFIEQAERMIERLVEPTNGNAGVSWPADGMDRIYLDRIMMEVPRGDVVRVARERLVDAINDGRTLTGFVGHGSPAAWTFQNLFTPTVAGRLRNRSRPTQVITLTCYTTYFVSPGTDTLAHQLLASHDGGAVVVHGASTLSSYSRNEAIAAATLQHQLVGAETIGTAIRQARSSLMASAPQAFRAVAINRTLLGDPTLRTGD